MIFFFDRTFGIRLPSALARLKPPVGVRWHQEQQFPGDMPDDEWMAVVAPRGWVVLSQDRKWHVIDVEKKAVVQHNLGCIYFPSVDRWQTLCLFTRTSQKLIDAVNSRKTPYIVELTRHGQIKDVMI